MPNNTGHRHDRAYRIANWSEIQQIFYTITLTAFVHRWAIVILSILIPSAVTVLQFLAALNRMKTNGYAGCAVAYQLLSQQIAQSSNRKCSVRTLERGLAFLKMVGLVKLHWWTMPDQMVTNGPYRHRIAGTAKVETEDGWKSQQIRIILLTDRAIAMWDQRTVKKGSDYIPYFAPLLTPANLAASFKKDQVVKPTMVRMTSSKSETSTVKDKDVIVQGKSTRPAAVEHQIETTQKTTSPNLDSSPSSDISTPPADAESVSAAENKSKKQVKQNSCQRKVDKKPRGCSHTPPPLPKNAAVKTSWDVARAYILVELHRCLQNFVTNEANSIYERAMYELSADYPHGFPTVVDWPYWVARFALFGPQQRRSHMYRDILPLIRAKYTPVPSEPSRFREHQLDPILARTPMPERLSAKLDPFLQAVWKKYVKD